MNASTHTATKIFGIWTALDGARRVDSDVEASWAPGRERRYADCRRMVDWLPATVCSPEV